MKSLLRPALTSIAFVVSGLLAWSVVFLLSRAGDETDQTFVDSPAFQLWVVVAAFAVVAFVHTMWSGINELRDERLRSSAASPRMYVGLYVVFAGIIVATLFLVGQGGPDVPVEYWRALSAALLVLGVAGAGPWIVLVWASHSLLSGDRVEIAGLPAPATDATATAALDRMLDQLLDIRSDIAAAVGRLLVLVLGAVLLSGALRNALVPDEMPEASFPASAVLVYGAFFTLALSLAVLPLMASWRRTAWVLVNQCYPCSVASSAEEVAAKERLVSLLDLNGSLFKSPVALSAVVSPLVISLLAVFIPQVGS